MIHRAILACEMMKKQCDALVLLGVPVHQIHYKELVGDTPKTMRGICEFLEVPFVPEVTSLEGADRSAVIGGEQHSMVKGKQIVETREGKKPPTPLADKRAAWREELTGRFGSGAIGRLMNVIPEIPAADAAATAAKVQHGR